MWKHDIVADLQKELTIAVSNGHSNELTTIIRELIPLIKDSPQIHAGELLKYRGTKEEIVMQVKDIPDLPFDNFLITYREEYSKDWYIANRIKIEKHGIFFMKDEKDKDVFFVFCIDYIQAKHFNAGRAVGASTWKLSDMWTLGSCFLRVERNAGAQVHVIARKDIEKYHKGNTDELIKSMEKDTLTDLVNASTIINVINCKNVSLQPVYPSSALNKKRIKHNKIPHSMYYVMLLDLNKGRTLAGKSGGIPTGTANTRVHICRGHFKEYTNDNPLFGKVVGRFWWQPVMRGNKELGTVSKDYRVK